MQIMENSSKILARESLALPRAPERYLSTMPQDINYLETGCTPGLQNQFGMQTSLGGGNL
jgi:hypothetical protein